MAHKCDFLDSCAFYQGTMKNMPESTNFVKGLFCMKKPEKCERKKNDSIASVKDTGNLLGPLGSLELTSRGSA